MRSDNLVKLLFLCIALLFVLVASPSAAYQRWGDGCTDCHDFFDEVSTKPGNVWPDDKHNVHRSQMMTRINNDSCEACHVQVGDDPLLNSSAGYGQLPALGCMGCHGVVPTPGTAEDLWGAGLRLHHASAGVGPDSQNMECLDCHGGDPLPMPEDVLPAYHGWSQYQRRRSLAIRTATENWTTDGLGLDNDGDGAYDGRRRRLRQHFR